MNNDKTIRFPQPIDGNSSYDLETYYAVMTRSAKPGESRSYEPATPLPMTETEWNEVHAALEADGQVRIAARLMARRLSLESGIKTVREVAETIQCANDPKGVCSVTVTPRVVLDVNYAAHGSTGADGNLRAMTADLNRAAAFQVHPGLGRLEEAIRVRDTIYCG